MYAIIKGRVHAVTLGEALEVPGVWARRHPGHKVTCADGTTHEISDELIYGTEERAKLEAAHLNRIYGSLVNTPEQILDTFLHKNAN